MSLVCVVSLLLDLVWGSLLGFEIRCLMVVDFGVCMMLPFDCLYWFAGFVVSMYCASFDVIISY